MKNYNKQATDFLTKHNASITITFNSKAINKEWKETTPRNMYDVTIKTPRGEMSFNFWDSIHNTEITSQNEEKRKAAPTAYHILACLTKYDPGLFKEFCSAYGYYEDSRTAERVYHAVLREYKQLQRIFTAEQLEELQEIQ